MDKKKLSVVSCLNKDLVEYFDEGVVALLYNNNKDYLYMYFLLAHPLV